MTIDQYAEPEAAKGFGRRAVGYLVLAAVLVAAGFGTGFLVGLGSAPRGSVYPDEYAVDRPDRFTLKTAWYGGITVHYFDFGEQSPAAAPMLLFFYEDNHSAFVRGQSPVVDTAPGRPGYSDFWAISKVYVPRSFVPNSARSFEDVYRGGYAIEAMPWVSNCPLVNEDAVLEGRDVELREFWYKGAKVYAIDMGKNSPAENGVVRTAKAYKFFHGNGTMVAGENTLFPVVPGDEGYSDLWQIVRVVVPDDFVAGTYRSEADLLAAADVTLETTTRLVNCPVVD